MLVFLLSPHLNAGELETAKDRAASSENRLAALRQLESVPFDLIYTIATDKTEATPFRAALLHHFGLNFQYTGREAQAVEIFLSLGEVAALEEESWPTHSSINEVGHFRSRLAKLPLPARVDYLIRFFTSTHPVLLKHYFFSFMDSTASTIIRLLRRTDWPLEGENGEALMRLILALENFNRTSELPDFLRRTPQSMSQNLIPALSMKEPPKVCAPMVITP